MNFLVATLKNVKRGTSLMVQQLRLHASTVGGTGLIPGRGSFPDSWASLIAQLVKNPRAMQETPVRFLGWEDLLEKG